MITDQIRSTVYLIDPPGIARAVASSCGRHVACILMFRALQCDDCGLCYRRGADGPLGRRSGCWYGCCLSE
jgi:hypothetical protein